jgi:ribosomal protein S18 acetylase RimI-like enzyme
MKTPMRLHTQIMTMLPDHILDILDVERELFPPTERWTEDVIRGHFHLNNVGYTAFYESDIAGYCFVETHGATGILRITNIAVRPKYQRYGVGSDMLDRVKEKLRQGNRWNEIQTTVSERSLETTAAFFKENNFIAWKVERDAFAGEDGIELGYWL